MTGKYGNWSAPFAKWVVEGWEEHSKAVGGPDVAARLRKDLVEKAKELEVRYQCEEKIESRVADSSGQMRFGGLGRE